MNPDKQNIWNFLISNVTENKQAKQKENKQAKQNKTNKAKTQHNIQEHGCCWEKKLKRLSLKTPIHPQKSSHSIHITVEL